MPTDIELCRSQFDTARQEIHQLYLLRHVWKNLQGMLDARPEIKREPVSTIGW